MYMHVFIIYTRFLYCNKLYSIDYSVGLELYTINLQTQLDLNEKIVLTFTVNHVCTTAGYMYHVQF